MQLRGIVGAGTPLAWRARGPHSPTRTERRSRDGSRRTSRRPVGHATRNAGSDGHEVEIGEVLDGAPSTTPVGGIFTPPLGSTSSVPLSPRRAPTRWSARRYGCPSALPHKSPQPPSPNHKPAPRRWRQRWIVAAIVGCREISMVTWQVNNDAQLQELFHHIIRGLIKVSQGCSLPSVLRNILDIERGPRQYSPAA
jgi:hypothetical protein